MATETSATPKMIVQYEWILENVEKEPMTIASKMILFRGERVFRVGLKNLEETLYSPVLFFMSIDLTKIGMRVEEVTVGIQDSENAPSTMSRLNQEKIGDNGNLQLFKTKITQQVIGNITFVFRICIAGSVPGFSYRLSDRLAKDQLWDAAKSKNSADVEFVVKGKTFFAHKAILAARSPVFAAEFTKEQPVVSEGCHQIHIDEVEPSTLEQFLYYIYMGESMGLFANKELLKLADDYQLTTLSSLCGVALKKIENTQMVSLANNLNEKAEIPSSKIRPEKETEIFFDRTTPTFRCAWTINLGDDIERYQKQPPLSVMQYQNEDIFIADFTGRIEYDKYGLRRLIVAQPVIHCSCVKHPNLGLKIEDIYFSDKSDWFKMESKNLQTNAELPRFTTQPKKYFLNYEFYFDIKMVSTIGNYYYEMMDEDWMDQFWTAATEQKFTDVEIFVGTVKVMEAHRVILSARSPVMNESFNKARSTGKSVVTFGAEFDADTVKNFLNFLYTGSLKTSFKSASHKKHLLKLATFYQVETLKNFCQLVDRVIPDVEELTNSMLGL